VLDGKKIFLVEDSIVRSTTMRVLLDRIRTLGNVKEIHVRVACPPIVGPCFYGVDMSTYDELFVPKYMNDAPLEEWKVTREVERTMAADLGADSLRYLPVESIARAIGLGENDLCQACINGQYPTTWGQKLAKSAFDDYQNDEHNNLLGGS